MPVCPKCGKAAKSVAGLTKHLTGTYQYGGHAMEAAPARALAESLAKGTGDGVQVLPAGVEPAPTPPVVHNPPAGGEASFLLPLFQQMAADKGLPKYQFERRVDAILAVLLPDLLSQLDDGDVRYVVSEFPLKKVTGNQSTNVDHVYFDHKAERWLFCELKTDAASVRDDQISIYIDAVKVGMPALVDGVYAIRAATLQPGKYTALLQRVAALPLERPMSLTYLAPGLGQKVLASSVRLLSYAQLAEMDHRVYPEAWDLFRSVLLPVLQ